MPLPLVPIITVTSPAAPCIDEPDIKLTSPLDPALEEPENKRNIPESPFVTGMLDIDKVLLAPPLINDILPP
jgi:hypothetical protein